jgi:acyl-CoA thioesterase FadM
MTVMEQCITVRFSHIDIAGIVFYARYFEILSELFPELPFAQAPFAMQTDFLKPNYLGDEVQITFDEANWSFTGRTGGAEHFTIRSLPEDESVLSASAHRPDLPAFQSDPMVISPWASDCTGYLQVSRFYELLNFAVEQWFARSLDLPFRELHSDRRWGTPSVMLRTRCRELPHAGDSFRIWIRPTEIGRKSLKYTCWLVRDDECLLENEQTIVFIKVDGPNFETIPIPDEMRERLQEQYVAT